MAAMARQVEASGEAHFDTHVAALMAPSAITIRAERKSIGPIGA